MALILSDLRCEYMPNPLGIDVSHPRLSWVATAAGRGQVQSAWQVQAASTRERLEGGDADLWDSGKVDTSAFMVEYGGRTLASGERCWWKVRVWDGSGQPGHYSEAAWFEMGLLSPADWHADWIGVPAAWPGKALYFRRDFKLDQPLRRARIYMIGLGWSELRVNGQRVNDRVLDPPQSDYAKRLLYSTDAVEDFLRPGNNTIGVICGNGWYGAARLLLQMNIEFEDGRTEQVCTESNWAAPWLVSTARCRKTVFTMASCMMLASKKQVGIHPRFPRFSTWWRNALMDRQGSASRLHWNLSAWWKHWRCGLLHNPGLEYSFSTWDKILPGGHAFTFAARRVRVLR
jgi:hypothetical protein